MQAERFGWAEDLVSGRPRLAATRCGDTVVLRGELDLAAATSAAAALAHPAIRTVDLSAVTFIDAAGLRVLLDAHRCWSRPHGLRLRAPSRSVLRLLALTGEGRTFSIAR
jgi:anti-anti-sigma factor